MRRLAGLERGPIGLNGRLNTTQPASFATKQYCRRPGRPRGPGHPWPATGMRRFAGLEHGAVGLNGRLNTTQPASFATKQYCRRPGRPRGPGIMPGDKRPAGLLRRALFVVGAIGFEPAITCPLRAHALRGHSARPGKAGSGPALRPEGLAGGPSMARNRDEALCRFGTWRCRPEWTPKYNPTSVVRHQTILPTAWPSSRAGHHARR